MTDKKTKNIVVLFDIDHTIFDTQKFWDSQLSDFSVHPDVIDILKKLQEKVIIGIFSQGEEVLQRKKLSETHIDTFFHENNIHISGNKIDILSDMLKKYDGKIIFLVDDKLDVLYEAHNIYPGIKTIWVKRGYWADKQEEIAGFSPTVTVPNFESLLNIIFSS